MLINKQGKIVANATQATVIFENETAYNTWIDAFPLPTKQTGETDRQAKERVYLPRFVVIKKYEQAEENGMVIYKANLAAIQALTGTDVKDKAIYVAQDTLKLYNAAIVSGATVVTELSNDGGVEVVDAFPAAASAEQGMLYVLSSTGEAKTVNNAGDALIDVADDVVAISGFDPTTTGKLANAGQIIVDTNAAKAWICLVAGTSGTTPTAGIYHQFTGHGSSSSPAEFYDNFSKFPSLASGLPTGYNVGDRFFVANDTMRMYAIYAKGTTPETYEYREVSTVIDNVDVCDFSTKDRAIAASKQITSTTEVTTAGILYYCTTDQKFYIFNGTAAEEKPLNFFEGTGSIDKIYVAKYEGITYIWDGTAYMAVGGQDEVQVYASQSKFPTTGQEGKLYVALDEAQCYVYNGGYVLVSDRATVLYASKSDFPAVGKAGMIYIAKDTGKMYYYDAASTATDKYVVLGDSDDVIVGTKAEIEALTLQKGVMYVASDEGKCYIAEEDTSVTPAVLKLKQVGGGEIPTYTQAAWDALSNKPDLAYISDSLFDAIAYQNQ